MNRRLLLQRSRDQIRDLSHELFFKSLTFSLFLLLAFSKAQGQTTFSYTGSVQSYVVPAGVTGLLVDAQGATGGRNDNNSSPGGAGGHVTAVVPVAPGETLLINVGGAGVSSNPGIPGAGGYNGGGAGATTGTYAGGGGGGATVIQRASLALVVAGGGGGAGHDCGSGDNGGASATSGMRCGMMSPEAGQGATTSAGGAGGFYPGYTSSGNGAFGTGGNAGGGTAGGGGGGGYYGGGGGSWGGGGGGSNYVATGAFNATIVNSYNTSGNGTVTLTPTAIPVFVTSTDMLTVCENSGATSIDSLLSVYYASTHTLTWTTSMPPTHGALAASYTTPGNGDIIFPIGLTYSPDASFSGMDTFIVSVSDGTFTSFDTVYVSVNATPTISLNTIPGICKGTTSTTLSYSNPINFFYIGNAQTWTVPTGVDTVTFDLQGAAGGHQSGGTGTPGYGGRVQGRLAVTPGEVLNIFVGGTGATGSASGALGGYNGGGTSVNYGGGGGGATDIRIGGTALTDRIIVAGAGGGGGADGGSIDGGNGGDLIGANGGTNPHPGTTPASGGSQVAGGVPAHYSGWGTASPGTLGTGGNGLNTFGSTYSAGGGAGYYGGGGGVWSGGGGGSSYTDATLTTDVVHTQGYNNGNGFASFTYPYPAGTTYSITWDAGAAAAGFTNVTAATLPTSPLTIAVPAGATPNVYTGTFTINTGMCNSAPQTIAITINPIPAPIVGDSFLCAGDNAILTNDSTSGTWSSADITVATIGSTSGSITAVSMGTSTISYTLPSGCYTTTAVTVNPLPAAIAGNTAICMGSTSTLSNDSTGGTWSSADITIATVGSASGIATPVAVGNTTISYTLPTGCFATTPVTVNPLPAAITGATFECRGNSYTLGNDSTGGTWFSSNTAVATIGASSGTVTAVSVGTSMITYALPTTCYVTTIVTVNPQPAAIAGTTTICNGSTSILGNDSTGGNWSSSVLSVATVGSASGVVTAMTVGNSVITYTLPAGCFTTTSVTVNPAPTAIGGASSLCYGTTYTLTNDSTGGTWSSADPTVANINALTGEVVTAGAGSTTITYQLTSGCYSTLAVTVHPLPVLTSLPIAPSTCGNTTFTYTPTADISDSITWIRPATYGVSNASGSGTGTINETLVDTVDVKTPVSYVFTLHLANCTSIYTMIDTVIPRPRLTTTTTPAAICDSTMFTYVPSSTQSGTTYAWVRPFVSGISSAPGSGIDSVKEILHNTASTNKDVVYLYTLTANGCSNTDSVTVRVHPDPKLLSLSAAPICSGGTIDYTPTTSLTIPVASAWTRPAITGISPAIGTGISAVHETLTNSNSTPVTVNYLYTLTIAGTSCAKTQTVTATVNPAVDAPVIATKSPTTLCSNTMYQNFGAATLPPTGVVYAWSVSNATIYATGTTRQYTLINFPNSGTAVVKLTALYGTLGCPAQDSVIVTVGTDTSATLTVIKDKSGALAALQNNVDHYQWGYDDAVTLDSTLLGGEINQIYFPTAGLVTGRNYWVITTSGSCMQKAYYNTPTGVTNVNDLANVMTVYPNPTSQDVTVAVAGAITGNITVEVTNLLGQKVANGTAVNNQAHLNVSELASGCYIVDCFANGVRIGTAKFIKN